MNYSGHLQKKVFPFVGNSLNEILFNNAVNEAIILQNWLFCTFWNDYGMRNRLLKQKISKNKNKKSIWKFLTILNLFIYFYYFSSPSAYFLPYVRQSIRPCISPDLTDQSEASILVTWSHSANQRPVSLNERLSGPSHGPVPPHVRFKSSNIFQAQVTLRKPRNVTVCHCDSLYDSCDSLPRNVCSLTVQKVWPTLIVESLHISSAMCHECVLCRVERGHTRGEVLVDLEGVVLVIIIGGRLGRLERLASLSLYFDNHGSGGSMMRYISSRGTAPSLMGNIISSGGPAPPHKPLLVSLAPDVVSLSPLLLIHNIRHSGLSATRKDHSEDQRAGAVRPSQSEGYSSDPANKQQCWDSVCKWNPYPSYII